MSANTLQRIWAVFEEALEYEDADMRRRFVNEQCAEDPSMLEEVRSLIDAHYAESLLDDPAWIFARPTIGTEQIGPYVIEQEIGRGGMGVVYKARDERLDRSVALKMLPRHLSEDREAKARLAAEARAAAKLEHPNIAIVHDIGEAPDGRMYIAMAYYEGRTLEKRIDAGPVPVNEAIEILCQIAGGLEKAHEAGIVHRDIKPANILITQDGTVKILDFGIAQVADLNITQAGEAVGTVAYMSPEQARGGKLDHRSDIWSLGVVLYEVLTGARPFTGAYNDAVLYAIINESPPAASSVRTELPPGVDLVFEKALHKEPRDRYDSAQALAAALIAAQDRPAAPAVPASSERIRATLVVSQLGGFMQLVDQLVPDDLQALGEAIRGRAAAVIADHGGLLHEVTDESITAIFGVPGVHEDDFVRAVRAARDLHTSVRLLADERCGANGCTLRLSTGIDTGSVVIRPSPDSTALLVTGSAVQNARRLSLRAGVDEILVSPDTERLVRPFFETDAAEEAAIQTSRGMVTPFRVRQETGSTTRLEAARESGLTAYAGRERDLNSLMETLQQSVEGSGRMVSVVGEAGMGKSRLLHEFGERVPDDVRVLHGRCVPHGGHIPYLPFSGVLRHQLELSDSPSEEEVIGRVRSIDGSLEIFLPLYMNLLTVESERHPVPDLQNEDLRIAMVEAICGIFTLGARDRPLLVLLEDWHWSDEASQDALKQIADLVPAQAMMVVVTYRPEYTGRPLGQHVIIHLNALDVEPAVAMISSVIGVTHVPEELGRLIHQRTGGNPFFLEEICRALLEENLLVAKDDSAVMVRSVDTLDLPDTVQAVIRARLHRLGPQTRKTLRVASVAGREFSKRLLNQVLPNTGDLSSQLGDLIDLGLIQQLTVLPEATYRFKHALTQEVVYDTLLHHQRKAFHRSIGGTLEDLYRDRVDEHVDLFIHHFSQAEDWSKAAHYSRLGAERAKRMGQLKETAIMLGNAVEWLNHHALDAADLGELTQLLLDLERACEATGDRARQQAILDELTSTLKSSSDDALLAEVHLRQGDLHILRNRHSEAERSLEKAVKHAEAAEDKDVYVRVLRSIGFLRWHEGRTREVVEISEQLLEMHREVGDFNAVAEDLVSLHNVMVGDGRYHDALRYAEQAEAILDSVADIKTRSGILQAAGTVHGLLGNTEEALDRLERAAGLAEKHRLPIQQGYVLMALANVHLQTGEIDRSLAYFDETVSLMREVGHAEGLAISLSSSGQALLSLSRFDEALAVLSEAAECFRDLDDVRSEAQTQAWMARILEEKDRTGEAERAWQRIADLLEHLDPIFELDAMEAFGRFARFRGDEIEALSHYYDAIELAMHLNEASREAQLRNTAGILEWMRGNYEKALAQYEKALPFFEASEVDGGIGLMLNSMAACLRRVHRDEEVLGITERALTVHRRAGNLRMEAHALSLQGDANLELGRTREAMEAYADSLQLRCDMDDRRGEGWMLQRMARAHSVCGDRDQSVSCAKLAAAIARELEDPAMEEACRTYAESLPSI